MALSWGVMILRWRSVQSPTMIIRLFFPLLLFQCLVTFGVSSFPITAWAEDNLTSDGEFLLELSTKTNKCTLRAVSQTLTSKKMYKSSNDDYVVKVRNYLPIPLRIYMVDDQGRWFGINKIYNSKSKVKKEKNPYKNGIVPPFFPSDKDEVGGYRVDWFKPRYKNTFFVVTDGSSGAIVTVFYIKGFARNHGLYKFGENCKADKNGQEARFYITPGVMAVPGDIGPPPSSTWSKINPGNSKAVLTGVSHLGRFSLDSKKMPGRIDSKDEKENTKEGGYFGKHDRFLIRTQAWQQSQGSIVVPPCEFVEYLDVHETGVDDESSSTISMAMSLGMNYSEGLGPISMSISASLSMSGSYSHTVKLHDYTTNSITRTIDNSKNNYPHIVMFYEQVDTYSVNAWHSHANEPIAGPSMIHVNAPRVPVTLQGNRNKTKVKCKN